MDDLSTHVGYSGACYRLLCVLFVVTFFLVQPLLAAPPVSAQRVALLIGCNGYSTCPLHGCVADVTHLKEGLTQTGWQKDHLTILADGAENTLPGDPHYPSKQNIEMQLTRSFPEGAFGVNDTALLFFSGHGVRLDDGVDYLVPLGGEINPRPENLVSLPRIYEVMRRSGAGNILVITDACRNVPGRELDTQVNAFGERSLEREIREVPNREQQYAFLRSCAEGQRSYEYDGGKGGYFATALTEGLTGKAIEPDGSVTLAGLFAYTKKRVQQIAAENDESQSPQFERKGDAPERIMLVDTPHTDSPDVNHPILDLARTIATAEDGATIHVPPGIYTLTTALVLNKSLLLIGTNLEQVTIRSSAEEAVVLLNSNHRLTLQNITFQHVGAAWANVISATGGTLEMRSCRCSGAMRDAKNERGGGGLQLTEQAAGSIAQCQFLANALNGIMVTGDATAHLDGNRCANNAQCGILFAGASHGTAEKNLCLLNGFHGIAIRDSADPLLQNNQCNENVQDGVRYSDATAGTGKENHCANNGYHGIEISGEAHPLLQGNDCQNNNWCGIIYLNAAGGAAQGNACSGNRMNGIYVAKTATVQLTENTLRNNAKGDLQDIRQ